MSEIKIIGLNAPKGFLINNYLTKHPANNLIVNKYEIEILLYIKSFYKKGINPDYSKWYAGMTDKTHNRYNAHKKIRKLDDLKNYKKFYLYSMSNARALEFKLYQNYDMGKSNFTGGIYTTSKYVYVFYDVS